MLETIKTEDSSTVFQLIKDNFDLSDENYLWMLCRNIYHVAYANPMYISEIAKFALLINNSLDDKLKESYEAGLSIPIVIVNYDNPDDPAHSDIYPVVSSHESLYLFGILAHYKIVKFTDHLNSVFKLFHGKSSFQKTPIFNAIIPLLCSVAKTLDRECPYMMKQLKRYLEKKKPEILNELKAILNTEGEEDILITPCIKRPFDTKSQLFISDEALLQIAISNDDREYIQEYFSNPTKSTSMVLKASIITPSDFLVRDATVLHFCAFYGAIDCFKYLIMSGADIKAVESSDEHFGLDFFATASGNLEIYRIAEREFGGNLAQSLYSSVCFWNINITRWLVENRKTTFTRDLLIAAASTNNIKIVRFLINKGVTFWGDENEVEGNGEFDVEDLNVINVEVSEDFDADDLDSSPLEIAAQWDCFSIVILFCQALSMMPKELFKRTFITAVEASSLDIIRYLANHYSDLCTEELITAALKSSKDNDLEKSTKIIQELFPQYIEKS